MFKLDIYREDVLTNSASFPTQKEAQDWFYENAVKGAFGVYEHDEPIYEFDSATGLNKVVGHNHIPSDFTYEILDITTEYHKEQLKNEMLEKGQKARKMCEDCLDVIAGFNIDRVLTGDQITQMQSTFGTIEALLKASRPASAKALIQQIVPANTNGLVTEEMKQLVIEILSA